MIWKNADIFSIVYLWTYFNEVRNQNKEHAFQNLFCKLLICFIGQWTLSVLILIGRFDFQFVNKFNVLYDRQGMGRRMRGLFF